jgi:hypothetical protein
VAHEYQKKLLFLKTQILEATDELQSVLQRRGAAGPGSSPALTSVSGRGSSPYSSAMQLVHPRAAYSASPTRRSAGSRSPSAGPTRSAASPSMERSFVFQGGVTRSVPSRDRPQTSPARAPPAGVRFTKPAVKDDESDSGSDALRPRTAPARAGTCLESTGR